jgi:hypothetical protein
MRLRLRHALRFALPTLLVVYLLGAASIAVDVFLLDDADPAIGAARTFWFDEQQWRLIAIILAAVVFLWKIGDVARTPPSWRYAVLFSVWLATAAVATAIAMTQRNAILAIVLVATAVVSWLLYRRRVPGRPLAPHKGAAAAPDTAESAEGRDLR